MKTLHVLLFLGFSIASLKAQTPPKEYYEFITKAEKLYEEKDFTNSALSYSAAFKTLGWKGIPNDRYNAACSYALANMLDSAFFQLDVIVNKSNFINLNQITSDADLVNLHNDKRWETLISLIKINKEKKEKNLNTTLVKELEIIFEKDQKPRNDIKIIESKYGAQSNEMKAHWKMIVQYDSLNLISIVNILDKYGWLGPEIIGEQGNSTLFLVIQHADITTQQKYLPMMREAVKKGNARASSLALLEDRILLRTGKNQIYGSQIGIDSETNLNYVLPLDDPDNVDKRRAEVGLQPLADYISHWNLTWDVEAYKKELPALIEKENRKK
jgi:hypothetical protein